jgi:hypothetical protein
MTSIQKSVPATPADPNFSFFIHLQQLQQVIELGDTSLGGERP